MGGPSGGKLGGRKPSVGRWLPGTRQRAELDERREASIRSRERARELRELERIKQEKVGALRDREGQDPDQTVESNAKSARNIQ